MYWLLFARLEIRSGGATVTNTASLMGGRLLVQMIWIRFVPSGGLIHLNWSVR